MAEISAPGKPDDLMAIASSYDSTGRYGAQTPFSDQLDNHWMGGQWEVDATHNSIIAVTNGGKAATTAILTFHYNSGKDSYQIKRPIAAGDQLWLNMSEVIHDGIADDKGRKFPSDLTGGTYELAQPDDGTQPSLFEGKIIVDKTYGHLTYGCLECCVQTNARMMANPVNMPMYTSDSMYVQALDSCLMDYETISGQYNIWDTNNHAVATMNNVRITADGIGTADPYADGFVIGQAPKYCPQHASVVQAVANVYPAVTSISLSTPLWFFGTGNQPPQGFTLGNTSATVTAVGGGAGTYNWTITSGSNKVTFPNNSSTYSASNNNTAPISTTSYSTARNDVSVQVQYTYPNTPTQTVSLSLSVDSPYKLLAGTVMDYGVAAQCNASGYSGFLTQVPYQIMSFLGTVISNIGVNESFAGQTQDYLGANWMAYVPMPYLSTDGTFADNICVICPSCTPPSLPPQSPLSTVKIDHGTQLWFVGSLTVGSGVEAQSDVLQRYQDHGRHLSIVSPVR